MEMRAWFSRLSPRERISVAIFVSLILLGAGLLVGRSWGGGGEPVVEALPESQEPEQEETTEPQMIFVHVCGQVTNPGVYELPKGARVFQALEQAGGHLEKADLEVLNLAQELPDGSKIYLPAKGEVPSEEKIAGTVIAEAQSAVSSSTASSAPPKSKKEFTGKVNINTANSAQLQQLSGIGPALAGRILEHRKSIGRFTSVEQLMDVSGIGAKTLAKFRHQLEL